MSFKGIDVCEFQDKINWEKVKNDGIQFAILRATYGSNSVDAEFKRNADECTRLGIPFGVYVYSYALSVDGAINEANNLLKTIKGYKLSYPVIIDMEDADHYKQRNGMPSNSTLVDICAKECEMFEEAGYYAMIYASKSWFDGKLKSSKLDRYDKWMAWWYDGAKFDTNKYGLWQYTSSGSVSGISGRVDMNISYKDYPQIINGNDKPEPKPQETEIKYVEADPYLNVRSGAGTQYKIVGKLFTGDKVTIYEKQNGFGRIGDGKWVSLNYLVDTKPKSSKYPLGRYKVNTPEGLNVREKPSTNAPIKKTYQNGTVFDTYQIKDNWGQTPSGWVCLDYCKLIYEY